MALKHKLNKEEFEKLSDEIKAEYISDGEGYKLDVLGLEDTGPLKRALERERENGKTLQEKLSEKESEIAKLGDPKKIQDISTLQKSYEKRLEEQKNEFEGKLSKSNAFIKNTLVDSKAEGLARELGGERNWKVMLPHVKSRLAADLDNDEPQTRVLDDKGQISASTMADLKKEFIANKDFSGIIVGSKASGGAPSTNPSNKFGGGANPNPEQTDFSKMSPQQMAAHIQANKEAAGE
ncbi:scaffolding protein [Erwinia phage AH03]|uniref:Scaffolding protein n=1 Tax=Erwinia phage AH03 TaxID=2869568 RepID=A0AAE7X0L3_9CAUD|nr:scaffolding protein [Erwinia phage AH03]